MPVFPSGVFVGGSLGAGAAVTHTSFDHHIKSKKIVAPDSVRFDYLVNNYPILGNRQHGDCEVAGAYHLLQTQMAVAGQTIALPTEAEALRVFYYLNHNTENGLYGYQILDYWKNYGLNGIKIEEWSNININWDRTPYNEAKDYEDTKGQIKKAVWLFGGAMLEILFPDGFDDQYIANQPWTPEYNYQISDKLFIFSNYSTYANRWIPPGTTYVNPPNGSNGHCMTICGYDDDWVYVVTWGLVKKLSWDYLFHYVTGVFAIAPINWLELSKKRLAGYTDAQLKQFLAGFKSPQFQYNEVVD